MKDTLCVRNYIVVRTIVAVESAAPRQPTRSAARDTLPPPPRSLATATASPLSRDRQPSSLRPPPHTQRHHPLFLVTLPVKPRPRHGEPPATMSRLTRRSSGKAPVEKSDGGLKRPRLTASIRRKKQQLQEEQHSLPPEEQEEQPIVPPEETMMIEDVMNNLCVLLTPMKKEMMMKETMKMMVKQMKGKMKKTVKQMMKVKMNPKKFALLNIYSSLLLS